MATINKVTERKMNGVCSVAASEIFDGSEKDPGSCFSFSHIIRREVDSGPCARRGVCVSRRSSPRFLGVCFNHERVFSRVCVYLIEGGGFCWMSCIVPVRPSDIAGGQRGMEPERGDSDK